MLHIDTAVLQQHFRISNRIGIHVKVAECRKVRSENRGYVAGARKPCGVG